MIEDSEVEISAQVAQSTRTDNLLKHCSKHSSELLKGYCKDCNVSVCWMCVTQVCNRNRHNVQNIEDAVREKTLSVEKLCGEIEKVQMDFMTAKLRHLGEKKEKVRIQSASVSSKIEDSSQLMTNCVRERAQNLQQITENSKESNIRNLDNLQNESQKCLEETKLLLEGCREKIKCRPGIEIFDMLQELEAQKIKFQNCLIIPVPDVALPYYSKVQLDETEIDKMLGDVTISDTPIGTDINPANSMDLNSSIVLPKMDYLQELRKLNTIQFSDNPILSVCPQDDDHAWILSSSEPLLRLVDREGTDKEKVTLQAFPSNIAINEELIFMTVAYDHCISTITRSNLSESQPSMFCSTGRLQPYGIAVSQSSTTLIWVGLVDKYDYLTTPLSKRLLRSYTLDGLSLLDVQYDKQGNQLFTIPWRISVSKKNMQVATANLLAKDHGEIVITDPAGMLVSTVQKIPRKLSFFTKSIHPIDVSFDINGNLIFSDLASKSIIIMDETYENVCVTYSLGDIQSLSCSLTETFSLWLGHGDGKVSVNMFLHNKDC